MNSNPAPRPTPNPPSDFKWKIDENGCGVITGFAFQDATEVVVPSEIDGRPSSPSENTRFSLAAR